MAPPMGPNKSPQKREEKKKKKGRENGKIPKFSSVFLQNFTNIPSIYHNIKNTHCFFNLVETIPLFE